MISYLDQINRYFMTRGKMASKVAKYPLIVSACTVGYVSLVVHISSDIPAYRMTTDRHLMNMT